MSFDPLGGFPGKPGRSWTDEERRDVKIWLNTPPQIGRELRETAWHLGVGTTEGDVVETWGDYVANELDRTIDLFDPSRGPFMPFHRLRLTQLCWRRGGRIRDRGEEPLVHRRPDGEEKDLEVVDSRVETEEAIVSRLSLEQCLNAMPPLHRTVIEMHYFQDMSVREIAGAVELSETYVKVLLFRGRRRLRDCLESDGV